MADGVGISLIGDKKLRKKFDGLEKKIQKKLLSKVLREAAKVVKASAKSKVNTGKTGSPHLKNNITVRKQKGLKGGEVGIVVSTGTRTKLNIDPKDPYYYPAAVEFGTSKVKAHPFLRPAIAENRDRLNVQIASALGDGIIKLAKSSRPNATGR